MFCPFFSQKTGKTAHGGSLPVSLFLHISRIFQGTSPCSRAAFSRPVRRLPPYDTPSALSVYQLIQQCIAENARIAQNQGEYEKRYNALAERFDRAKERLGEVEDGIVAKQAQREMMQNLMDTLEGMPDAVDSFDEGAWYALVDYATVYGRDDVRFTFKNGMEIKA